MHNLPQGVAKDTISLMIGHPDPAALLTPEFAAAVSHVLDSAGLALPYGAEQGSPALIKYLVERIGRTQTVSLSADQVMITAGSTHANDLIARLYGRGGAVIVEAPTYADALHIFRDHDIPLYGIPMDDQGMITAVLANLLQKLPKASATAPRLFYTIPNFHNPTGITTTESRRREILRLAGQYGFAVVEDDVYRELAFDIPLPPSYLTLAQGTGVEVMQIGSFSKTLAPGLRLGWIASSAEAIARCIGAGTTQMGGGANPLSAQIAADYVCSGAWEAHVEGLRGLYQTRRDLLLTAMDRFMPAGVTWTRPDGGFFVWVTLPKGMRGQEVKREAAARGVLVASGEHFFIDTTQGASYLRLTYSFAPPEDIEKAVQILSEVISALL